MALLMLNHWVFFKLTQLSLTNELDLSLVVATDD